MWVHPYTDTPLKVGVDFWEIGGMTECESFCKVMVEEASKPRRLHPTSIQVEASLTRQFFSYCSA